MGTYEDNYPNVALVGAGPGDVRLLTIAAVECLTSADVVIYDRLVDPSIISIVPEKAEKIYVGKKPSQPTMTQEQINSLLVEKASDGKFVVRLKGGDPFIFGRGGEEAQALKKAGLKFQIVPGITSAVGAADFAGISLTDRYKASSVTFITGHEDDEKTESSIDYEALARMETVVFYMSVGNLPLIAERLIQAGRAPNTPAAIVERATTPNQRTITSTLEKLPSQADSAGVTPPAIIIVGKVVELQSQLKWFEQLPLFGKKIVITRAEEQSFDLFSKLKKLGADVIKAPTISIELPDDTNPVDEAIFRLSEFDWLVFTSPNGADAFLYCLLKLGLDLRALGNLAIAAIGPATADALRNNLIEPDLVPEIFTTEALAKVLTANGPLDGQRFLLARADIATEDLANRLRDAGATVEDLTVYHTLRPDYFPHEAIKFLRESKADWITFTSSSTVDNFVTLTKDMQLDLSNTRFAAIGPVTADALRSFCMEPAAVAQEHTIDGLIEAILQAEE